MKARLFAAMLAGALASATATAQQPVVQWNIAVQPETVTVGQPFTVTLHVRAPEGASVTFPVGPDSTAAVQPLDPRALSDRHVSGAVDRTASYRLAAWNVGTLSLALPDVVVRLSGRDQHIALQSATVFAKSVLPADSAKRVPRPARDIFVGWAFPWWVLAVVAMIAIIAWLTRRRRRGRGGPLVPAITPFERAEREFTRVAALGLVEAGERGRYVSLMTEVVRDYLWARFPMASLSLTTPELLREVADAQTLPHERLEALLVEADMIKFARRRLTTERALELGREARALVVHEHVASTPAPASEAA